MPSSKRAEVVAVPARRSAAFPIAVYFGLACLFTWALLPLTRLSVAFSLVALCGPAAAAAVAAAMGGPEERGALRRRATRWRVGTRWYLAALLLPLPVSGVRSGVEWLLGARGPIELQPVSALNLVVFVLVAGEEIGWRGFALPRLAERAGWLRASVVVGVLWAVWHLPLFHMAGMPQYGTPFLPYVGYTIGLSVILGVLALGASGSVVVATLFHGAVNTFGIVNAGAAPELRGWSNAASYGLAACVVAGLAARRGMSSSAAPDLG